MAIKETATELWKLRPTAEALGVRPSTLYRWVHQGRLPVVRLSSRALRFNAKDVQRFIERSTK